MRKSFNRKRPQRYSYRPQQTSRKRRVWITALLISIVLGTIGYLTLLVFDRVTAKNDSNMSVKGNVPITPVKKDPAISQASLTGMDRQINQIISQNPDMQIAVSITDLKSGNSYHYGVNEGYLGASTAKLITATLFLHEIENGSQTFNTMIGGYPASYQLRQLIEQSDNNAWVALNGLLGHVALQAWAAQVGLTNYDADTNILTSDDMALLLTKLYQNKLLNAEHTELLLSYMQNASETEYIESAVPEGVKVFHKAGWLSDRVHDAAIIDDGKNPYVLVIFSKTNGAYNTSVGQEIFHSITAATTSVFIKS